MGMPGVAITDHGNMSATYDLYKASKAHGGTVKSIFGIEAYLSPQVSRDHRSPVRWDNERGENELSGNGSYSHMTLLAQTDEGLHNLMNISSEAFLTGFYYKPRADMDLLQQYGKGIVATTGCVSGEVQTLLRLGKYKEAVESAAKFRDVFDKGNFYVELMDHGIDIEQRTMKDLILLAKELNLPMVVTNDVHYTKKSDFSVHEALLCVGSSSTLDNPDRFKFDGQDFYLKSAQEMRSRWDSEIPEGCDNTLVICESITATFHEGKDLLPKFDVPEGETEASWLEKETYKGLAHRYPNGITQDRKDRAEYELRVINQMGFASYFLVTADFIQWSKTNGMRVGPGRGSAAGSMVSYALGITDLDPIRHGLLFERFLNSERVSMPDIDIDFDVRYRENVIKYVSDKYGHDKVANISTSMMMKGRSSIKDAARVLGAAYGLGDKLSKLYPKPVVGRDLSLADLYDPSNERYDEGTELRNMVAADPEALRVVELARGLEGTKRGFGMHAAGIIMSREPLTNTVPLMKKDNNEGTPVMTQFEYPVCEKLGLLKMDFLGLSNLSTLSEALRMIKINKGIDVDLNELGESLNDTKTFRLLARGDTLGVFQLDSGPIRSLLRLMSPDKFDDIAAVLSLYRPGPMGAGAHIDYADRKMGRKRVIPIHPELAEPLKDILGDTWGVICYQEQVMSIAQKVAGYTLGQADILRRAMGKKSKEILDKEFVGFAAGMKTNGYSQDCIEKLWAVLIPFADYAFNKSHAAAYGMVAYWTAYLKANFPTEYMAALLSTNADDKDKSAIYLGECRRMGLQVLVPDINLSESLYSAVGDDIRVGLSAIKGVGSKSVEAWLQTRATRGPATSFSDFLEHGDPTICKKNVVAALIKAGAFDSFGKTRSSLELIHEEAVTKAAAMKKSRAKAANQDSLFGAEVESAMFSVMIPDVPEWDRQMLLGFEREMLGLYVSDHPLSDLTEAITGWQQISIADLKDGASVGTTIKIAGLITSVERKVTKKGDAWALVTVEDLDASISVMCFPRTYNASSDILVNDAIVIVSGKSEMQDDGSVKFMASSVSAPSLKNVTRSDPQLWRDRQKVSHEEQSDGTPVIKIAGDPSDTRPVRIKVKEADLTPANVESLKVALADHPGYRPVEVHVLQANGETEVLALEERVVGNADLAATVRYLFGITAV
jgi:DNA polymerase-3 subunit alpha